MNRPGLVVRDAEPLHPAPERGAIDTESAAPPRRAALPLSVSTLADAPSAARWSSHGGERRLSAGLRSAASPAPPRAEVGQLDAPPRARATPRSIVFSALAHCRATNVGAGRPRSGLQPSSAAASGRRPRRTKTVARPARAHPRGARAAAAAESESPRGEVEVLAKATGLDLALQVAIRSRHHNGSRRALLATANARDAFPGARARRLAWKSGEVSTDPVPRACRAQRARTGRRAGGRRP